MTSVSPPTELPLRFCKQTRNQFSTSQYRVLSLPTTSIFLPCQPSSRRLF